MNLSVTELVRNFSAYLNRVSYRGESFQLVRGGKVLAELHPAPQGRRLGDLPAVLRGLPRLDSEDARLLDKDLQDSRKRLNAPGRAPKDPWES